MRALRRNNQKCRGELRERSSTRDAPGKTEVKANTGKGTGVLKCASVRSIGPLLLEQKDHEEGERTADVREGRKAQISRSPS